MSEYFWRPRCAICGRFVSYDADYCVRWGSYGDSEPPDPDYYCQKCVETEKDFIVSKADHQAVTYLLIGKQIWHMNSVMSEHHMGG